MSFILDALKKVDREGHPGSSTLATAGEARVALLERSKRRRSYALMVMIALVSAGLTVAVLKLVPARSVESEPPLAATDALSNLNRESELSEEPKEAASSPSENERSAGAEPSEAASRADIAAQVPAKTRPATRPRSARADEASSVPKQTQVAAAAEAEAEAEPQPEPEPSPPTVVQSTEEQSANAIRLVGSGRSGRSETETETETETEADPDPLPAAAAKPPEGLPHLVLQGTSVVNGRPVAVISDRRVFEGDHIDGAVVVHIQERSVELEFEGHRFTLSL